MGLCEGCLLLLPLCCWWLDLMEKLTLTRLSGSLPSGRTFSSVSDDELGYDSLSLTCVPTAAPKRHKRSSSSPDSLTTERMDNKAVNTSPSALYKLVIPLLRCEVADVRDAAVHALGKVNSDALKDLMEELVVYIREAVDRKQENMRRRRRRDALRLQLVKVFELIAGYGTFGVSSCVLERDSQSLHPTIVEYVDGARLCLEAEPDKEALKDIKIHFCNFIRKMLKSFPLETYQTLLKRDLRRNLFVLFAGWSGSFGRSLASALTGSAGPSSTVPATTAPEPPAEEEEQQFCALQAMSAVLCCGPCFEPSALAEEGCLYPWLDSLLASKDEKWSKTLDFGSELEMAQVQILSVAVALFISTLDLVLYRLSPLFCLIRSSHRSVAGP
ncbi:hypothetical protein J6590_044319 [Homalodisca vitripennis]|nr:hypothetical protein J6590_044319 [Homalodisca vitripennis]